MKKRILSVLLSMVVATTISSAVPMSIQAETTAVKTAVQSANTAYGSNTTPGKIDAKDIKEWKDKKMRQTSMQDGIILKGNIMDGRVLVYKHMMNRVPVTMF